MKKRKRILLGKKLIRKHGMSSGSMKERAGKEKLKPGTVRNMD